MPACLIDDQGLALERRIPEVARGQAACFGASCEVVYVRGYPVLVNHPAETELARAVALEWAGESRVIPTLRPFTASEDFAFMLEKCPGAYIVTGNGDTAEVHHPKFDFNDDAIPFGAGVLAAVVERKAPRV